ncbi:MULTISPECIES: DoxX family protein [Flavobacterium]|uniref:DoxX family protein n=1 Tax=Flavobacterium hankyongi TaxID=1176532 RepID=A0ABP8ZX22_9FLAO|nr:DoxX family protein [Flavobacterium sp. N1846]
MKSSFILRVAVAIILIMHSVPGMFNNGINDFGNLYLNQIGFAPFGLALAWSIKLSHLVTAILLLIDKYVKPAAIITILILIVGIFMVHLPDGWYVVGGGRNGVEFNFLLIAVLIAIMYPNGISIKK